MEDFLSRQYPLRKPVVFLVLLRPMHALNNLKASLINVSWLASVSLCSTYISWLQSLFSVIPWRNHFRGCRKVVVLPGRLIPHFLASSLAFSFLFTPMCPGSLWRDTLLLLSSKFILCRHFQTIPDQCLDGCLTKQRGWMIWYFWTAMN